MERNERLSKWFKKLVKIKYGNTLPTSSRNIFNWYKKRGKGKMQFRTKDGEAFIVRDHLKNIAKDFYQGVILEGITHPGKADLMYLGTIEINEINSVSSTGNSRKVPDDNGGFKEVVDDYFSKSVRYFYTFKIMRTKLRVELRDFFSSSSYPALNSKYLRKVYDLHPEGKFYHLKK
jgi:hypothetical protein